MPVTVELLEKIPLFQGIGNANLSLLAQHSSLGTVKQGQEILARGAVIGYLTFVIAGQIQATECSDDGRIIGTSIVLKGEAIGCLTLIDGQPSTLSLCTTEDCKLLLVPIHLVKQLLSSEPIISERLLVQLARMLRSANRTRAMLSLPNAFHRIFTQLHLMANNQESYRQALHIPKQQDIAVMVNTSRETVSRALNLLIKSGILTKSGHRLGIKEPDTLSLLARDGPEALPKKFEL